MIERKEEIMKKATELFSEGGYDNTSTRELAKAVDLSVAGLYYFFQNKEEILFNILNQSLSRMVESVIVAVNNNDDPQTNIKRIIENLSQEVLANKMEIGLLLKESERLNPEQLLIINNKKREVFILIKKELSKLNDEGRLKNNNLTFITFALLAVINFSFHWFNPKGKLSIKDFIAETNELFFNGVLKDKK